MQSASFLPRNICWSSNSQGTLMGIFPCKCSCSLPVNQYDLSYMAIEMRRKHIQQRHIDGINSPVDTHFTFWSEQLLSHGNMIIFLTVVEMFKCTSVNNYIYVETKEFLSKWHLRYQNVTTSSQSQMKTSDWKFFLEHYINNWVFSFRLPIPETFYIVERCIISGIQDALCIMNFLFGCEILY